MLLVHARARDPDLNKAIRRLRMKGAHELLVRAWSSSCRLLIKSLYLSSSSS